jgi:hypothetical protein
MNCEYCYIRKIYAPATRRQVRIEVVYLGAKGSRQQYDAAELAVTTSGLQNEGWTAIPMPAALAKLLNTGGSARVRDMSFFKREMSPAAAE